MAVDPMVGVGVDVSQKRMGGDDAISHADFEDDLCAEIEVPGDCILGTMMALECGIHKRDHPFLRFWAVRARALR